MTLQYVASARQLLQVLGQAELFSFEQGMQQPRTRQETVTKTTRW